MTDESLESVPDDSSDGESGGDFDPDTDIECERGRGRTRERRPEQERESAHERDRTRDRYWAWAWRLALSLPLAIPWVFVRTTSATLVFPWGMVAVEGWYVTSLPAYLSATAGLPRYLELWPLGTACYGLALAWAAGERLGADQRVTAGLLVLSAFAAAWVAAGLGVEPARTAVPVGSVVLFVLAVWAYVRA